MLIFASGRCQTLVGAVVSLVAIYLVRYQSVTTVPSRINQFSKTSPTKLGATNRSFFEKMSPRLVGSRRLG